MQVKTPKIDKKILIWIENNEKQAQKQGQKEVSDNTTREHP